jgi:integrase
MSIFRKSYYKIDPKTGEKIKHKYRKWYIKYRDGNGIVRKVPGCTDKAATLQLAAQLERDAERKRVGVADPFESHRKRPLSEHLKSFESFLVAKGNSKKHVQQVKSRAEKLVQACKFVFSSDVSPSVVQEFFADLRRQGRSAQTMNFYLQAMKQFVNWMVKDSRMPENPLRILSRVNVRKDRRHDRRPLGPEELARLVEAADEGKIVEGIQGRTRGMLYLFSSFTGLRRKELASLTPRSLDFASDIATVTISAAYAKNGREDKIPIHPIVAHSIQQWIADEGFSPTSQLFSLKTGNGKCRRTSKMMIRDLKMAREKWIKEAKTEEEKTRRKEEDFLNYRNAEGLFADFHANRHTFITNLGRAGVHPKLDQVLARHSTINLTMNVYTHTNLDEKARAVAAISAPMNLRSASDNNAEARTDPVSEEQEDVSVGPCMGPCGVQNGPQRLSRNDTPMARNGTESGGEALGNVETQPTRNSLSREEFGSERHGLATLVTGSEETENKTHPEGLEPPTVGSEDRCSIQLSYRCTI